MLSRAEILAQFGLQDRPTFEIEPHRDGYGLTQIKFSHEGDPATFFTLGSATRLAAVIRSVDSQLADQVEACIEKAKRYSTNSN